MEKQYVDNHCKKNEGIVNAFDETVVNWHTNERPCLKIEFQTGGYQFSLHQFF